MLPVTGLRSPLAPMRWAEPSWHPRAELVSWLLGRLAEPEVNVWRIYLRVVDAPE